MGWAVYYTIQQGEAAVLRCVGDGSPLILPEFIAGCPVTALGSDCFAAGDWDGDEGLFPVPTHTPPAPVRTPGNLKRVTLPGGLRSIGERAFARCPDLRRLTLPDGVDTLGERVFEGSGLEHLELPDRLEALPDYAFSGCRSLKRLTLGQRITTLGHHAFYNCRALEGLELPRGVSFVGEEVFLNCAALTRLTAPLGVNLSVMLSDLQNSLTLTVLCPDGEARFFLPGFSYEYESITAPRVWRTITYGAGRLYRECFSSRDIDFDLYESYFVTALLQDDLADTVRIAFTRLRWPYHLNKGREIYLGHLRAHLDVALEQLMAEDDTDALEVLLHLTHPGADALDDLTARARRRNKVFFVSRLMEERMGLGGGADKDFSL